MLVEEIQMLVADVVLPPPDITVSQWADDNRRLSSESAAERGEWRTDRAPYQRAIMDALSPSHPCEQVVLMSGAQLGKTSILENFIGYIIDLDPGPVLLVQPREADCEAFSKDRLAPMLRDCGTLRGKVADARSRDSNNTILHKKFTGGSITMSAASSPAGLAMRSIRYCLLDEVDRYPASAGTEGDPVNLAITRTANFWNRKIVLCSTPTVKGASRIEAAWLESNQQMYWVPCPHCGTHEVLRWANVEWPEGDPDKAQYRCEHCGQMIGEHQKSWMLKHGEWRAARPDSAIAGFWINSLYSPWRKWRDLARKFLSDQKSPETLREFVNTVLAEPWDDEAQTTVDISELLARREHYRAPVPAGAAVLTCGVDVQADRLELELVGWGRGEESWSIEYRVIPGDPTGAAVWAELDAYLQRQWHHENGTVRPVAACCIDSGYESQAVYDFCRTRYHRRIFAVKGQGGPHPVWPKIPTAKNIRGERPWMVGTDSAKATIMGRLRNAQPGTPGHSHFPADRQQPYFEQLLGEALVTTYSKGQPIREWRPKKGVRHEALDAKVYAYAALRALVSMGLVLDAEVDRIRIRDPRFSGPPPSEAKIARSRWMDG
jgi:phage terminase large subunit GpA-like protein